MSSELQSVTDTLLEKTLSVPSARSRKGMSSTCRSTSLRLQRHSPARGACHAHPCPRGTPPAEPLPAQHRPRSIARTLYLSIGSSCCSWLSRMVWYSLSYFFSFFVCTCGTHLENRHLKIGSTGQAVCKRSLQTGSQGRAGEPLLNNAAPHCPPAMSNTHQYSSHRQKSSCAYCC